MPPAMLEPTAGSRPRTRSCRRQPSPGVLATADDALRVPR